MNRRNIGNSEGPTNNLTIITPTPNAALERPAGTGCTTGDTSGTGPDGNQAYPLTGTTDCNTNTTGAIIPLGLADCEADLGTEPRNESIARSLTVANDDLSRLRRSGSHHRRRVVCVTPLDHPSPDAHGA
jgi:hypothetical protein